VDKKLIEDVAARLSMRPSDVEHEEERPQTLFDRLARSLATLEPGMGAGWTPPNPDPFADPHKEIVALTQQLIREAAAGGNVVIVGRGAGFLLSGKPGLLRVFLHAPRSIRVRALTERLNLTEAEAGRQIQETDANRAAYIRQVYGRDWLDPNEYDLTINTGRVGYEAAAAIILRAVEEPLPGRMTVP
jgi:cytidylate kinase